MLAKLVLDSRRAGSRSINQRGHGDGLSGPKECLSFELRTVESQMEMHDMHTQRLAFGYIHCSSSRAENEPKHSSTLFRMNEKPTPS